MARRASYKSEEQTGVGLFPKPAPVQTYCHQCGDLSSFALRDVNTNERIYFCSLHVPEDFGIPKSIVRMFEEAFLENNSTGSASNAPADISSLQE